MLSFDIIYEYGASLECLVVLNQMILVRDSHLNKPN